LKGSEALAIFLLEELLAHLVLEKRQDLLSFRVRIIEQMVQRISPVIINGKEISFLNQDPESWARFFRNPMLVPESGQNIREVTSSQENCPAKLY
jgi:hypothetical protein